MDPQAQHKNLSLSTLLLSASETGLSRGTSLLLLTAQSLRGYAAPVQGSLGEQGLDTVLWCLPPHLALSPIDSSSIFISPTPSQC